MSGTPRLQVGRSPYSMEQRDAREVKLCHIIWDVEAANPNCTTPKPTSKACLKRSSKDLKTVASLREVRRSSWCGCCSLGKLACSCCLCCLLGVVAGVLGAVFLAPRKPVWEVTKIDIHTVNVPALGVANLRPADTSACPAHDLCGVATARGCSRCPSPSDRNFGCLCVSSGDPAPTDSRPQPGSIISANTSACPAHDLCGVATSRGCSTCPLNQGWINDGCTCRQPLSVAELIDSVSSGINGFLELLVGANAMVTGSNTLVSLGIRATVAVTNPNYIAAQLLPGSLTLKHGSNTIGRTDLGNLDVPARSQKTHELDVWINEVTPAVGMQMLQAILKDKGQISITAEGTLAAKSMMFEVQCSVRCETVTDLLRFPSVTEKECIYEYGL